MVFTRKRLYFVLYFCYNVMNVCPMDIFNYKLLMLPGNLLIITLFHILYEERKILYEL